jgi:CubicO group peptidase (beta-lactamase class C family)
MTGVATVPSLCMYAISRDGTIVNERGGATMVLWWSFAKTVIAAAFLALVLDGKLRLARTLDDEPFSLRQLLQHRAGLPDYGTLPQYHAAVARGDQPWPASELLDRVGGDRPRYRPGTGWLFSNVGYFIARQKIEHITGTDLASALRLLVLDPLGLDDVRRATEPADLHDVAMGNASDDHPGWVYHGLLVGPFRSATILLDRLFGADFLVVELREQMLRPHVVGGPTEDRPWKLPGYGLGIMCGDSEYGHRVAGHTGSGPGSVIAVYRNTDSRASGSAAAFLADGTQGQVERAAFELATR